MQTKLVDWLCSVNGEIEKFHLRVKRFGQAKSILYEFRFETNPTAVSALRNRTVRRTLQPRIDDLNEDNKRKCKTFLVYPMLGIVSQKLDENSEQFTQRAKFSSFRSLCTIRKFCCISILFEKNRLL